MRKVLLILAATAAAFSLAGFAFGLMMVHPGFFALAVLFLSLSELIGD